MNLRSPQLLRTITIAVITIGLVVLALGGFLTPLSRYALAPFIFAQTWLSDRFQAAQTLITSPRDITVLRQRNAELESEVARLESQVIELQQRLTEYQVLTTLLDFARAYPDYHYTTASVIGRDPSPFVKYIQINRGSDDGLRRGMPVVNQKGLVGRISQINASAALVQLITDPGNPTEPGTIINVIIEPEGAEALLQGSITGDVSLDFIPKDAIIEAGNLVLTSGIGGNLPPNILIGQITSVRSQIYDLYQTATVQPVVDFSKLDIVLVITNFQPSDTSQITP